jgi:hypothetical protein
MEVTVREKKKTKTIKREATGRECTRNTNNPGDTFSNEKVRNGYVPKSGCSVRNTHCAAQSLETNPETSC